MQSMFADGASAVVVGAGAEEPVEVPVHEMVSASQSVAWHAGLDFRPSRGMPALVRQNIEALLERGLTKEA
jgi:predicted naringenin-chalcone synthase